MAIGFLTECIGKRPSIIRCAGGELGEFRRRDQPSADDVDRAKRHVLDARGTAFDRHVDQAAGRAVRAQPSVAQAAHKRQLHRQHAVLGYRAGDALDLRDVLRQQLDEGEHPAIPELIEAGTGTRRKSRNSPLGTWAGLASIKSMSAVLWSQESVNR